MRKLVVVLLGVAMMVACGDNAPRAYKPEELPKLVLQPHQAPANMKYDAGTSGTRELNQFTNDAKYQRRLQGAGFVTSYFALFSDAKVTILASSGAILFKTPEGAQKGMELIEDHIRDDGKNLRDVPAEGLGEQSIGIAGDLQPGYPPGFEYLWIKGNIVFSLVGAGPVNTIRENAVRALAERMEARTD